MPIKVALVAAEHELHTGKSGQPWMKLSSSAASTERLEFSTSNGGRTSLGGVSGQLEADPIGLHPLWPSRNCGTAWMAAL